MARIQLLLTAVASLVPACAGVGESDIEQHATFYAAEGRRCNPNMCILFTAQDSDHDGVADVDELAAGTNPHDPLSYPAVIDLAKLMVAHQLPTFEIGNSLMVLLPTKDANGLPVFGGEGMLASRKSSLETAGIIVPARIDISRGFTMGRTAESRQMSFGQLFTAFGRPANATIPVRLLADAIGSGPSADWSVTTQEVTGTSGFSGLEGTLVGKTTQGERVTGTWFDYGDRMQFEVHANTGEFHQKITIEKDAAGNITTTTLTTTLIELRVGPLGESRDWKQVRITTVTSPHGRRVTTTRVEWFTILVNGEKDLTGYRETTEVYEPGEDHDHGSQPADDPPPGGHDPNGGDDPSHTYIDPEAAEHSGIITATPEGMRTALRVVGAAVLVVQNDNDPLSNYEVPPTGIHDKYGPIALYGGDDESAVFGVTPAFVRVPQPEYDPNLTEQKPPLTAPPDGGCLNCYQPPLMP